MNAPKIQKIQNNFILVVQEKGNNLMVALKMPGGPTGFVALSKTAFPHHPHCPGFYHGFCEYADAAFYKEKWQKFFEIYLNVEKRGF